MTAEFHSLGLAQPSPHPSSGMTSRNTRASLTSIKYFQTKKTEIFSSHLGSWSLCGDLSGSASLQEGRHLVLLDVLRKILRGLSILILGFHISLGVNESLSDLSEASMKYFQTKKRNIFHSPAAAAQWRGVLLLQSARLTSAPSLMRVLTMLTCGDES